MIKPAILFEDQLRLRIAETWYDPDYMYYYDTTPGIPDIADKPDNQYQFVSVDEKGEVVGFFSYWVYEPSKRAMNFGLMAFRKHNRTFIKDAVQMFKDMFEKFGIESAEWRCYADNNEALKLYRHIIKEYGGVEVGTLRRNGAPQNRKICDTILFEILKDDLHWNKTENKILNQKEYAAYLKEYEDFNRLMEECGFEVIRPSERS
jgi:RimJ/RimL family protein N-acetyltransferase